MIIDYMQTYKKKNTNHVKTIKCSFFIYIQFNQCLSKNQKDQHSFHLLKC